MESSRKEEITITGNKEGSQQVRTTVTTTTTTITSNPKQDTPKEESKTEEKTTQQNFMCYPMMMYPGQNQGAPMMMPMQMPTQSGESGQQQPMICMMPVCFMDPKQLPKDMKFPTGQNMPFQFCPFPMAFPQSNSETK